MVKYLECPDLHRNPAWGETSRMIERAIIEAAKKNEVDFVALVGDYWDAAILATDKGGINEAIAFVRELRSICPIVAVYGTRSHDAPGSYGPLSQWVKMLNPGEMYGLWKSEHGYDTYFEIKAFNPADPPFARDPNALLFGIPEITKDSYLADHPTTDAERANAEILKLVDDLIDNEIAPMRALMPNVPAIGLLHGNVSDATDRAFESDNILKRSDIVIKTDTLERAGLTRWALGHIHSPWESRKICGGYAGFAGIDRNSWGKTGFIPAMNLVTIDAAVSISRIPYGTPMRVKLTAPIDVYDPTVAYWLEASDESQQLPSTGIHPWSRRTEAERTAVSRRVDTEALESAKTLTELARLFDPELPADVAACFDEIEKTVKHIDTPPRVISVDRVRVTGCILFDGRTVDANVASFAPGLTQLAGENGTGKSSAAGWMTPYPCFIGKNTDSGRQSAIKDFFTAPDSGIEKWITFNGQKHHHLITIKGAHTKTPKTECFFEIDGVPVQDKTLTFDEMMAECEARYGLLAEYLQTSFYVQPLQGPFDSGLMTATMTTIRDLVQSIAGIDRTQEKRYALDRIAEIGAALDRKRVELETVKAGMMDANALTQRKHDVNSLLSIANETASNISLALDRANMFLASERARANTARAELDRKATLEATARELDATIAEKTRRVDAINAQLAGIPAIRASLETDAETKRVYDAALVEYNNAERVNAEIRHENELRASRLREIQAEIDKIRQAGANAYKAAKSAHDLECARIAGIEASNAARLREIALIEKPCPQCGYIDADTSARVAALRATIAPVTERPAEPVEQEPEIPAELSSEFAALSFADSRAPVVVTLPPRGLSDDDVARYRQAIENAAALEAERGIIAGEMIPSLEARRNTAARDAAAINATPVDISASERAQADAARAVDAARERITALTSELARIELQLSDAEDTKKRVDKMTVEVDNLVSSLASWKATDALLAPAKIPAMELDAVLDSIDREATHRITPYRSGRYMFQTVTKDGEVDRFDIRVIDKETGREKSFLKHSVGEKSFLNAAYTWALVKVRKQRMKTEYTPVILDEADSFIGLKDLPGYYEMQSAYFDETGGKAIAITHSPEAGAFITNHVDMEEIKR